MNVGVCLWKIRGCWEDIEKERKKDMCLLSLSVPLFFFILFYFFLRVIAFFFMNARSYYNKVIFFSGGSVR